MKLDGNFRKFSVFLDLWNQDRKGIIPGKITGDWIMETTTTLSQLFECGIGAEKKAHVFYLSLARRFLSRPDISAFWESMAKEEEGHARIFERSRDTLPKSRLDAVIEIPMAQRADALDKLSVFGMLDSVHNLDDAYQLAHELESSDMNVVFNFLKFKLIPDGEKPGISPDVIERHLKKPIDFQKAFGEAQFRKQIPADS
jgi:hypothetical protein